MIATTARPFDLNESVFGWSTNPGSGLSHNNKYGFGIVNAGAAVVMAKVEGGEHASLPWLLIRSPLPPGVGRVTVGGRAVDPQVVGQHQSRDTRRSRRRQRQYQRLRDARCHVS